MSHHEKSVGGRVSQSQTATMIDDDTNPVIPSSTSQNNNNQNAKSSKSRSATLTPVAGPSDVSSRHEPRPPSGVSKIDSTHNQTSSQGDNIHDMSPTTNWTSSSESPSDSPTQPRLSRAYSTPLPQQITHWQRPRRLQSTLSEVPALAATDRHFQDLALELADSVQLTVQTLLQLSPPQIFDHAKEQFSPCTVQIPTPSLSALLTSMKNLNYISANMQTLGAPSADASDSEDIVTDEFDIGEVLQSVGDSFSGLASDAEVDVVLHHGDAIQHAGVKGDECGISYALTHVIHQILATTQSGDSLEVGLSISGPPIIEPEPPSVSSTTPEPSSSNDFLTCTFDILHKFCPSQTVLSPEEKPESFTKLSNEDQQISPLAPNNEYIRFEPSFSSIILQRLLSRIDGVLRTSMVGGPDASPFQGRRCQLMLNLERGPHLSILHQRNSPIEEEAYRDVTSDVLLAREPSLDELMVFAETLRGKEAAFYASSRSSFAHHLTRYLASWGVVIAHIPTDRAEERDFLDDSLDGDMPTVIPNTPTRNSAASDNGDNTISMIIIDDDIHALRQRLLKHRAETVPHMQGRKRPSLAANHRTRSSPSIRNVLLAASVLSPPTTPAPFTPVPIIHFTSLARYKLVKDVIQGIIFSPGAAPLLPEVIVIPKPAGPRRILAALHTAVMKPVVDPFFSPIATSPMSPGLTPQMAADATSGRKQHPPAMGSRNGSGRAARSNSESLTTVSSISPLTTQEAFEYFPEETVQLGDSPASGLVFHSPDGRPGILFQPQSRSNSMKSESPTTEHKSPHLFTRRSGKSFSHKEGLVIVSSSESVPRVASSERVKLASGARSPKSSGRPPPSSPFVMPESSLKPAEYGRTVKSPAILDSSMEERLRTVAAMSWQEATKHLAMSPVVTPGNEQVESITPPVPSIEPPPLPPTIRSNNNGNSVQTTSTSPDPKLSHKRSPPILPKQASATKGKKSISASNGIVPPINVLIVEDNPINQTLYTSVLRRNSIKYEVAWNGREAVEKWRNGNFHLILMDIQMPIMDGITATKEIRMLEKANEIREFGPMLSESPRKPLGSPDSRGSITDTTPFRSQVIIVALTASSLQSDRVAALAAGCNDFLTKPVDNDWLIDKVIEWGSIKALQMWANLEPRLASTIDHDQAVQAQTVARRLHLPPYATKTSPEKPARQLSSIEEDPQVKPERSASELQSLDEQQDRLATLSPGDQQFELASESPVELTQQNLSPTQVSGETALLRYIEESQSAGRPSGGVVAAVTSVGSIASVMHHTRDTDQVPDDEPSDDPSQPLVDHNTENP